MSSRCNFRFFECFHCNLFSSRTWMAAYVLTAGTTAATQIDKPSVTCLHDLSAGIIYRTQSQPSVKLCTFCECSYRGHQSCVRGSLSLVTFDFSTDDLIFVP